MLRAVCAALLCALPTAASALNLDGYTTFNDGGRPYYNIRVGNLDPAIGGRLGMLWNESFRWDSEPDAMVLGEAAGFAAAPPVLDPTFAVDPAAVAPVPEPGEWAMIMAGLGVVGFAAARRKRLTRA